MGTSELASNASLDAVLLSNNTNDRETISRVAVEKTQLVASDQLKNDLLPTKCLSGHPNSEAISNNFVEELDEKNAESEEEDTDEDDDELRGMMLKNINEPAKVSKKNSKTFVFKVGTDIFDLGLDNSKLYCGVVICLKDKGTKHFYPGTWEDLNISAGTLSLKSHVPNGHFCNQETFSFYYAVCQSDSKKVLETSPQFVRASQNEQIRRTKEVKAINDSNALQQFSLTSEPEVSTISKISRSKDAAAGQTDLGNDANVGNTLGITGADILSEHCADTGHHGTVLETDYKDQMASNDNNSSLKTAVTDLFAKVKSGNSAAREKSKWSFLFQVRADIFDLGLGENLYCGVVVITQKNRKQYFDFFPARKIKVEESSSLLLEVNLTAKDVKVNRNFRYAYAVSSSSEKMSYTTDPSQIFFSDFSGQINISKEPLKLIDDTSLTILFQASLTEGSPAQLKQSSTVEKSSDRLELAKSDARRDNTNVKNEACSVTGKVSGGHLSVECVQNTEPSALDNCTVQSDTELESLSDELSRPINNLNDSKENVSSHVSKDKTEPQHVQASPNEQVSGMKNDAACVCNFNGIDKICGCTSPEPVVPITEGDRHKSKLQDNHSKIPGTGAVVEKSDSETLVQCTNDDGFAALKKDAEELHDNIPKTDGEQQQIASNHDSSSLMTDVTDLFAKVKNGDCAKKEKSKWSFLFHVGFDIFTLGLSGAVYCGVVVITGKNNKQKTYEFFPAKTVEIVESKRLSLEVNLMENDVRVKQKFQYAYAVSSSADKMSYTNDSSQICLSKFRNQVTIGKEPHTILNDVSQALVFKPSYANATTSQSKKTVETSKSAYALQSNEKLRKDEADKDEAARIDGEISRSVSDTSQNFLYATLDDKDSREHLVERVKHEPDEEAQIFEAERIYAGQDLKDGSEQSENLETVPKVMGNDACSRTAKGELKSANGVESGKHLALKNVIGNPAMDSSRDESHNHLLELNAIVGDDLCDVMENKKCKICVATSVDNFENLTPGFVMADRNGKFWIRFKVNVKQQSFVEYKYVAAGDVNDNCKKWNWETVHIDESINRRVSRSDTKEIQHKQPFCKYDGVIMFSAKTSAASNLASKLSSKITQVIRGALGLDDVKKFYVEQSFSGLELYLEHFVDEFCVSGDGEKFISGMNRVLSTISFVRYGKWKEKDTKLHLLSKVELLNFCLKSLVQDFSEQKSQFADQHLDSVKTHMMLAAVFLLSSMITDNLLALLSSSPELLDEFLSAARFSSEKFRATMQQRLTCNDDCFNVDKIGDVCLRLLECDATKKTTMLSVLFDWLDFSDVKNRFIGFPTRFDLEASVLDYVKVNYASMFARKRLLHLCLGQSKVDLRSILILKLPLVDHLQWMCDKSADKKRQNKSVFRCDRILELMEHSILNVAKMIPNPDDAVHVVSLSRQYLSDISLMSRLKRYEKEFVFNFLAVAMDVVEQTQKSFSFEDQHNLSHNLEEFFGVGANVISICMTGFASSGFSQFDILHWSEILRHRQGFPPMLQNLLEGTVNESFRKHLGESEFQLYQIYYQLPDLINQLKQTYPNKDTRELESLFDLAFVKGLDTFMRDGNAYDWNAILDRSPKVFNAFIKIAEEQCPRFGNNESAYECVNKVLQWKPFLQLYDLSFKREQVSTCFGDKFQKIKRKFDSMLQDVQTFSISFSDFAQISSERTAFTNVCVHLGVEKEFNVNHFFKDCSVISSKAKKCFSEISQLEELVSKFTSQDSLIRIDVSEYTQMTNQWKDRPLNQFVEFEESFPVAKPGFLSQENVDKINTYTQLMNSRIFSTNATTLLKKYCDELQRPCTIKELLDQFLPEAETSFLEIASKINSGRIDAKSVQNMFKDFEDRIKLEEMDCLNDVLSGVVNRGKQKRLGDNFDERKHQIMILDSLDLNIKFVKTLIQLKTFLKLEQNFIQLDFLHTLVRFFHII